MDEVKKYNSIVKKCDNLRRQTDRAQATVDHLMERLKKEFGCNSLSEAKKKLKGMQKEVEKAEKDFKEALDEFEKAMKLVK